MVGREHGELPVNAQRAARGPADAMCDAIALLDAGLCVKFATEAFYETLSVGPEQTLDKPFYKLGHIEEGNPDLRSRLERVLRSTNGFEDVEIACTFSETDKTNIRVRAYRIETPPSQEPIVLLTLGDATAQHRINDQLQASEERYRTLVDTAHDGIWTIDNAGNTTFANSSMAAMLGTTVEEMIGNPSFAYVFEEDRDRAAELFQKKIEGDRVPFEFRIRRADGSWFWASVSGTPLKNANGETVGLLGAFRDITERKLAEEAIMHHANELARSNADLQHFAYVTSHDLMEPLRTMRSYSQLLLRRYSGQLDADAEEFLGYIAAGADRMSKLVQDLLAYSKSVERDAGVMGTVELQKTLDWARQNLATRIRETGADIQHGQLPEVHGDELQLVQLFQNLLSNAIKYRRPNEPPRIEITAQFDNGEWVIAVQDNGIGIPNNKKEDIFGIFKRLHGPEVPGTGIGLAICRKIADNHGGRIWVESESGKGSTFFFTVPAKQDRTEPRETVSVSGSPASNNS